MPVLNGREVGKWEVRGRDMSIGLSTQVSADADRNPPPAYTTFATAARRSASLLPLAPAAARLAVILEQVALAWAAGYSSAALEMRAGEI